MERGEEGDDLMSDRLKGKDFLEEKRMADEREQPKRKVNPILEFIDDPQLWDLWDPRYDWLSDKDRTYLDNDFEFSWYDILICAGKFMTFAQMKSLLMTNERKLDDYCQTLWRKPIRDVYEALVMAARNGVVDGVFRKYADCGNPTAMSILAHSVMKMDDEAQKQDMRVTFVNDLKEG